MPFIRVIYLLGVNFWCLILFYGSIIKNRTAPAPVVGWPPIRSFRKNLAGASASKLPASESPNDVPSKTVDEKPAHEPGRKNPFVKINMDGVPIGRKVDLNAYDSYEKLSAAVDELFRGLLAGFFFFNFN